MKDYLTKIKVDKKVKPISHSKRKQFELVVGNEYYVSFGLNVVTPCKLIDIDERGVTIDIPTKVGSKKGYIDIDGNISHDWKTTHSLFKDEIGRTPEEAVINEVTL